MLFNSLQFVWFFPLVVALYFVLKPQHRWKLLLAASYYFYMCWKLEYILLIVVSTLIDYFVALKMSRLPNKQQRKKYLAFSLIANLGILFGFKYFNFVSESLQMAFNQFNIFYETPAFNVLLPVGISFYTFQTLSYTIDVYRGKTPAETHFGRFALYVSFFPQLVAGPIERANRLLPQFHQVFNFDYQRITSGLRLMFWGFFKKVVIADNLADYVNVVYAHPDHFRGFVIILATFFFTWQVYCDFSGYSDIAIGAAQVMGFRLMDNFRRPYFSKSMAEFWRRWHISLSTWFKDYIYIPLGGNRVSRWRWYTNLVIVFLISGLWHGADWTFVVFGFLNGFYLVVGAATFGLRRQMHRAVGLEKNPTLLKINQVATTFLLFAFSLFFFRAASITDAFTLMNNALLVDFRNPGIGFYGRNQLVLYFVLIAFLVVAHFVGRRGRFMEVVAQQPTAIRWPAYFSLLLVLLLLGNFGLKEFIYFQF